MAFPNTAATFAVLVVAAWLTTGRAQTLRGSKDLQVEDVAAALERELASRKSGPNHERIEEFEKELANTYKALPKNPEGHLEPQAVRYVLHRLFVQRHGWYVKGLEPGGDTFSAGSGERDWVPSYLVKELDKRSKDGISLHDLAALAAALEDVAGVEVRVALQGIYRLLGFPEDLILDYSQAKKVIDAYMVSFVGTGEWHVRAGMKGDFQGNRMGYWNTTEAWFRGIEEPFVTKEDGSIDNVVSFEKVQSIAQEIGAQYRSYMDPQCSAQKHALLNTWSGGNTTGRVPLSDFYKLGLTEKAAYLKSLGALEEKEGAPSMVLVPNYLTARPNCQQGTHLYSVCCRNECEDLMGQLERELGSPAAGPEHLGFVLSMLGSETKKAPWQLGEELWERLDDIAVLQGGEVIQIHGRLFAQWMHHAFPSECPFPHEAGSSDPVTPDEWMSKEVHASEKEIEQEIKQEEVKRSAEEENKDLVLDGSSDYVLPWSTKEELLGATHVDLEEAAKSLAFELSGKSRARVAEFRKAMQPFYNAWPKDAEGRVEHATARYVLHRLFVQRHNWFLTGLEHNHDVWQQNSDATEAVKDWVPEYMINQMEEKSGFKGLDLNDLAALAAAIEDVVNQAAEGSLMDVYHTLKINNETERWQLHRAISVYMVMYLGNGAWPLHAAVTDEFAQKHSYWAATERWFAGVEASMVGNQSISGKVDFKTAARVVQEVGGGYGAYNHGECQKLKTALLGTWSKGNSTGRVRLVDFYKLGLDTEFGLIEKPGFLRAIGALDESNKSSPMVIVPNYLAARPNCLQATALYAICCKNECEDLMMQLEATIAAPTAAPKDIAKLVSSLGTATVAAPRQLPRKLLARLDDIAAAHGGEVNLHGRLFAQWMHHSFPSECPYPHEAGTADPVSPEDLQDGGIEASEEERRLHVEDDTCGSEDCAEQAAAEWNAELPWSETEELLSATARAKVQKASVAAPAAGTQTSMWPAALLVVAALGAALMLRAAPHQERQKFFAFIKFNSRLVLVITILVLAFVTNMVDRVLIILICISGAVVRLMASGGKAPAKVLEKEKCFV